VLLLALLAAALVVLRTDFVAFVAITTVTPILSAALGERVAIGGIGVNYVPLQLTLRDLRITHEADAAPIAVVAEITATFGVRDWRAGLLRVDIDQPAVTLHLDRDGLREFRKLRGRGGGEPARAFPWRELSVRNGSFRLESSGLNADARGIELSPHGELADLGIAMLGVETPGLSQHAQSIALPNLLLTPSRIRAPEIDIVTEALTLDGAVDLAAQGPVTGDLSIHVDLAALTSGSDPSRWVDGTVDLDASLEGTAADATLAGAFVARDVVAWSPNAEGVAIAHRVGDVDGPWRFRNPDVSLGPVTTHWAGGDVAIEATYSLTDATVSAGVTAENLSFFQVMTVSGAHRGPWVDFLADVEIHVGGTLQPLALEGPFEVDLTKLRVTSSAAVPGAPELLAVPRGRLAGRVKFEPDVVTIDAAETIFGRSNGRARATIGLHKDGPLDLGVHFDDLELAQLAPLGGAGLDGITELDGRLEGPFHALAAEADLRGIDLTILQRRWADAFDAHLDSPDLKHLDFSGINARLGETTWRGNVGLAFPDEGMFLDTQVYVPDGRISDLAGIFVDLPGLDGRVSGTVLLAGTIDELEGDAQLALGEMDLWGERFPEGRATAWMDGGLFTLDDLRLERGDEAVVVRGSIGRGWRMNLEALTDGVRLEHLDHVSPLGLPLVGSVVADVQVGGTLFDWEPRGRVTVQDAYYGDERLADSRLPFWTKDGAIHWKGSLFGGALTTAGSLGLTGQQPYDLHADFLRFPLHVLHPRGQDGSPVEARLTGGLDLSGHFGDSPTPVIIDGTFDEVLASWAGHTLTNPDTWIFNVNGRNVQIPRLTLNDDETSLWVEGSATADGRVGLKGGGKLELDLVRCFAPGITAASGVAEISDFTLARTSLGEPVVTVDVKLEGDASIRTEFYPNSFDDLTGTLHATSSRYAVEELRGHTGGGNFKAGGTIDARGWWPTRYALRATVNDTRVRYFEYLPPMTGDAELAFDGPVGDLLLSGDITVRDMAFVDRIDWEENVLSLQSLTGATTLEGGVDLPRTKYFSMDLRVHAPQTVRLRNNLADAEASAELRVLGDTARPGMTGRIDLVPGGRAFLQDREFEITRGEARYTDPWSFDPELDLVLETDVQAPEQEYHINLLIFGPFSDFKTDGSSDPSTSQADVNTLLLFGMTRDEFEQYGGVTAAFATQGLDILAQQAVRPPLLDRWNVVSGVSERGSTTNSDELRFVGEKEWAGFDFTLEYATQSQDFYVSAERKLLQHLYTTTYFSSQQQGRALPIGGAWGAELKYRWELD
jgi:hypothetical protein